MSQKWDTDGADSRKNRIFLLTVDAVVVQLPWWMTVGHFQRGWVNDANASGCPTF